MSDGPPLFERVEEADLGSERTLRGLLRRHWPAAVLAVGVLLAGIGFTVEHVRGDALPVVGDLEPMDWLLAVSLFAIATVLTATVRTLSAARRYSRALRRHPAALAAGVVTTAFLVVGLVAPLFESEPTAIRFTRGYQPPVGTSVSTEVILAECVGTVSDGRCHGTWKYPLGTTRAGRDVLAHVLLGTRTAVELAVVSAVLLVGIGVSLGLVSASIGGRVDATMMRLAEILGTVPAVIVYMLFWNWNVEYRLLMLVAVFGLVNWGGIARTVRNEALALQDRPFVKAARVSGASRWHLVRHHLLPNVTRPVVATLAVQVPAIVLTEAALSFVVVPTETGEATLGDSTVVSWGQLIHLGANVEGLTTYWWITTAPLVALVAFALSIAVLCRGLNDVRNSEFGR